MELRSNGVIDIQLVQSNEVHGSSNMEKARLVKSLQLLENEHQLPVSTVITDRHPQMQSCSQVHQLVCHHTILQKWHTEAKQINIFYGQCPSCRILPRLGVSECVVSLRHISALVI